MKINKIELITRECGNKFGGGDSVDFGLYLSCWWMKSLQLDSHVCQVYPKD